MRIVLATRASRLARWQAETARDRLRTSRPDLDVELLPLSSSGDRDQTTELSRFGRVGIFTAEVDRAVLDGRAHAGVHSMKDMTSTLEEGLSLEGALSRGPVHDAWICPAGHGLDELPPGARVATGSRRRAAMLRAARPDLEVVEIRGNVETRLERLEGGAAEAMILACAGLERLGLKERITERLDLGRFLPAVGQGIVGMTCREEDGDTARLLGTISDRDAFDAGRAERALLAELRGGCSVPLGANATVAGSALSLSARVLSLDGTRLVEGAIDGARVEAEELGRRLAIDLASRGARELIEESRT